MRYATQKRTWKSPGARRFAKAVGRSSPEPAVEHICRKLVKALDCKKPPFQTEKYEYARLYQVPVIENDIYTAGTLSVLNGSFVIEVKKADPPARRSFSVCHELGHIEILRRAFDFSPSSNKCIIDLDFGEEEERLAEIFAVNMLMPRNIFKKKALAKEPSIHSVLELAEEFCTSWDATARRIAETNAWNCVVLWCKPEQMITGRMAVQIREYKTSGNLKWCPCEGRKYVNWGRDLVEAACKGSAVSSGPVSFRDGTLRKPELWQFQCIRNIVTNEGEQNVLAVMVPPRSSSN